jgi:hypothetical protein
MMALTSGLLETCVRALGTCGPSRTGRPAKLFYVYDPLPTGDRMMCGSS